MPPCSQCNKPSEDLWPEGRIAYEIWHELDRHDRQYMPLDHRPMSLSLASIRAAVADYEQGLEMQKLVLALEDKILGMKLAEHDRKMRRNGRKRSK